MTGEGLFSENKKLSYSRWKLCQDTLPVNLKNSNKELNKVIVI